MSEDTLFTPFAWVGSPLMEEFYVLLLDVACVECYFYHGFVVSQRGKFYLGCLECFFGYGETVGVACHHANHFATMLTKGFNGFEATSASRDEVFYHYHFHAFLQIAFDEVGHAVVFGFRTYVGEGKAQCIGYECTLCDSTCGYTCNGVGFGILFGYDAAQLELYKTAK